MNIKERIEQAILTEKLKELNKMKKNDKNKKCFECEKIQKNEECLDFYPYLAKWVKICYKCRKKFSDFAVKQAKANKKYTNWYEAKYQESLLPKFPKNKILLPVVKEILWSIDETEGEYYLDENGHEMLHIMMKNGKIYRAKYIGDWK